MTEVIIWSYTILGAAVAQNCDFIALYIDKVELYQHGKLINTQNTPIDYRPSFNKILQYDQVVRNQIITQEDTPHRTIFRFTFKD